MLPDRKLGAGPPCMIDIAIISPHSLKSPELIANVDFKGLPFEKNFRLMTSSSSKVKGNHL